MVGVQQSWSVTANDNDDADTNINYAEGQTPASLNNSARAGMAATKGFANQIGGAKTSGGSSSAYTFTSDSVAAVTAYAAGMRFAFKANHTNSGASTLNVDGVGAKSIKKGGAQAALAASDIVSGGVYDVVYEASGDCFLLLNPESGQTAKQPLDATLTALAALSWSSGNALVQFTAADTVSLTLAPSVTSVTAQNATGATTVAGRFVNTTDAADVDALSVEGDRATMAANDIVALAFKLSDSAGNQDTFARIAVRGSTVTNGAEEGRFFFYTTAGGASGLRAQMTNNLFSPGSNGSMALGNTSLGWNGAHFATDTALNWANGLVTLTHNSTSDALEVGAGAFRARSPRSTETGSTLTAASSNKVVLLATAPTIDGNVHAADDQILLVNNTASSMTITAGSTGSPTQRLSGTTTTGNRTLAARGKAHVYFISATEWSIGGDVT